MSSLYSALILCYVDYRIEVKRNCCTVVNIRKTKRNGKNGYYNTKANYTKLSVLKLHKIQINVHFFA